jgi:hypothetical protein
MLRVAASLAAAPTREGAEAHTECGVGGALATTVDHDGAMDTSSTRRFSRPLLDPKPHPVEEISLGCSNSLDSRDHSNHSINRPTK